MKTILVGNKQKYKTVNQVFDVYRTGDIKIILLNDIEDDRGIVIPEKIRKIHIYSHNHIKRRMLYGGVTIYIQGEDIILEDIESYHKSNGILFLHCAPKYKFVMKNISLSYFHYQNSRSIGRKYKNEIQLDLCAFDDIQTIHL